MRWCGLLDKNKMEYYTDELRQNGNGREIESSEF